MMRVEDKDLIAHSLRELSPRKASNLERAMQADPALAARYDAYVTMLRAFKAGAATMAVDDAVVARNWNALQPSLIATRVRPVRYFRWRYSALAGAGLALAATAFFVATRPYSTTSLNHHSPLREQGRAALSTPHSENASVGDVLMGTQSMKQQRLAPERSGASSHSPIHTPRGITRDTPEFLRSRTASSRPLSSADASDPHFIPLASVSMPALPVLLPAFVMAAPTSAAGPPQAVSLRATSIPRHPRTSVHHDYPTDLTFAMGGTLIGTREVSGPGTSVNTLGATHAVSALAAFHQQLRPTLGYRVAVSYTRPDFLYSVRDATTSSGQRDINGRIYELGATYVVQGPHRGALSTSAEAGGGLMAILPTVPDAATSYNLRGTALAGISADIALTKHLGIQATYRAQAFKGPNFHDSVDKQVSSTIFFSNEPVVGITYRFHSK